MLLSHRAGPSSVRTYLVILYCTFEFVTANFLLLDALWAAIQIHCQIRFGRNGPLRTRDVLRGCIAHEGPCGRRENRGERQLHRIVGVLQLHDLLSYRFLISSFCTRLKTKNPETFSSVRASVRGEIYSIIPCTCCPNFSILTVIPLIAQLEFWLCRDDFKRAGLNHGLGSNACKCDSAHRGGCMLHRQLVGRRLHDFLGSALYLSVRLSFASRSLATTFESYIRKTNTST